MIRILKRFDDGWRGPTPVYTYVAVRATPKGWYMTGRRSGDKGFHSWDTLVEFIGDSSAELVTGWTSIGEEHGS